MGLYAPVHHQDHRTIGCAAQSNAGSIAGLVRQEERP